MLFKGLCLLHGIALLAIIITSVAITYKVIIIFLIFYSLFYYSKKAKQCAELYIRYSQENGWEKAHLENQFESIEILPSTFHCLYFVVLYIKKQNSTKQTILICKDALKNDGFRKLTVELKISGICKVAL